VFFFEDIKEDLILKINPKNTCLITEEPPSVRFYSRKYTDQFKWVLSCQKNVYKRKNGIKTIPLLPWLVGIKQIGTNIGNYKNELILDYDYFSNQNQIENDRLEKIAVITSNKRITKGHCQRLDFIEELSKALPDTIDIYGNGFRTVEDKYDVYKRYKYVLVLENCQYPSYWTEKLADAYLSNCFPFYVGAPDILDYFPKLSLKILNLNDARESSDIIKKALGDNIFKSNFEWLMNAKNLVLNNYNRYKVLDDFVRNHYSAEQPAQCFFNRHEPDLKYKLGHRIFFYFGIEL